MIKNIKRAVLLGLVALILTAAAKSDIFFEIKKNYTIFGDVFNEVSLRYVDDVDPGLLMQTGISAMLELLDPYTVLIDEAQNQEMDILTTGKYAGVGIDVGVMRGEFVIIAPLEGYPAEISGVKAGDVIIGINDLEVDGLSKQDIEAQLYGEPGSVLKLKIKRYGLEEPIEFTLQRKRIDLKSVPYAGFLNKEEGIVYLQMTQFSQNSSLEVKTELEQLQEEQEIKSVIFDLRNNPGGLLDEAVNIIDLFIPSDVEVVRIKGRNPQNNQSFYTKLPSIFPNVKLIILQNNGSASASEIVAGAIQDLDRGVIVGENSFGKGLVQTIRPISYNNSLKITTSRYYIPSGRSIQSLRYSHQGRNDFFDIPDSLRKQYKTAKGRVVYDGNGIEPDVELKQRDLDLLEIALQKDSHYFYFANEYVVNNQSITFEQIKNEVYDDFMSYLKKNDFNYETHLDKSLKNLKKNLEQTDHSQEAIGTLETILDEEKNQNFEKLKYYIQIQLYNHIASRLQDSKTYYPNRLALDPIAQKGLNLAKANSEYETILNNR